MPPPPPLRPRRLFIAVTVAWGLLLAGGIVWSVEHGGATDRTMTTVSSALPAVDRATVELVRAATTDGQAVAAISGLAKASDCNVTPFRAGARYQRVVSAFVSAGTEEALLGRVRDRLPPSYGAAVRTGSRPRLTADAGSYVLVTGAVDGPGQVRFTIDTGDCRVVDLPADLAGPPPSAAARAPLDAPLHLLASTGRGWTLAQVDCPGGGVISTVTATADGVAELDTALGTSGGTVVVAGPALYGYRADGTDVAAVAVGDTTVLTATRLC